MTKREKRNKVFQNWLESLNACAEARTWVGTKELAKAWTECTRLDWLQWLVKAAAWAEYKGVTAPAQAEYERVKAAAWAEYERVTAPARAEYQRVDAPAQACTSCDELRSKFRWVAP